MWKPWILAAIGSIIILNVSARGFSSDYSVAHAQSQAVSTHELSRSLCKDESERACGAKVSQEDTSIVINDKETYQGSGNPRTDLVNAMKSSVQALNKKLPGRFNSLVTNIKANVAQDIKETTPEGVDSILSNWNLPQEVTEFLATIKFSESVKYQTYRFALRIG
jgi:Tfp pilus assembly protein FimT